MAIQVSGTEVISNARALTNVASIDATTAASITAGGVGGSPAAGTLGGVVLSKYATYPSGYLNWVDGGIVFNVGDSLFRGAVAYQSSPRNLWRSTDYGATWSIVVSNWGSQSNGQLGGEGMVAHDGSGNVCYLMNGYYRSILRSSNSGTTWTGVDAMGVGGGMGVIASGGSGYFIASGSSALIYRSSDNGASWSQIGTGVDSRQGYIAGNTLILGANDGFWRSTNFKTGWSVSQVYSAAAGFGSAIGQIMGNGSGTWVTSYGWWSTNDGVTWNTPTNAPGGDYIGYANGKFVSFYGETYGWTTDGSVWTYAVSGAGKEGTLMTTLAHDMQGNVKGWGETATKVWNFNSPVSSGATKMSGAAISQYIVV